MTTAAIALEGLWIDAELRLLEGDLLAAAQLEATADRLVRQSREAA